MLRIVDREQPVRNVLRVADALDRFDQIVRPIRAVVVAERAFGIHFVAEGLGIGHDIRRGGGAREARLPTFESALEARLGA